jgi:hypothetical protein
MPEGKLFLTFIPALVTVLLNRETAKGSPLTEQEVIEIRDKAAVVALPEEAAAAVAEQRGYQDIDPERCWEQWQEVRIDLKGKD